MGPKTVPDRIPEDFYFSCVFWWNFSLEHGFGGVAGIPVFFLLLQEFFAEIPAGQEFLYLLRIPRESGGFLQIPVPSIAVWLGQRLKKALCYYTFQID